MWLAVAAAMALAYQPGLMPLAAALGLAAAIAWAAPRLPAARRAAGAMLALAALPVFFFLRTNWLNGDGSMLTPKFQRDVPLVGAHLSHDELLEFFVHSRFWYYTQRS